MAHVDSSLASAGVLSARLLGLLTVLCWAASGYTAELAVLWPENWEASAPKGREVDAIYGDIVLRNNRIVAVIANPIPGRSANLMVFGAGGAVIDLTLRDRPNDQLTAFSPGPRRFPLRFVRAEADGITGAARQTLRGHSITLVLATAPTAGAPGIVGTIGENS